MKRFTIQSLLTIIVATLSATACIQRNQSVVTGAQAKNATAEVAVKRVQVATRFKKDTQDRPKHDANASCGINQNSVVKLVGQIKIQPDGQHVSATLAPGFSLPNCNLTQGYFFGPHLYGDEWAQKKADEGLGSSNNSGSSQNETVGGNQVSGEYDSELARILAREARRNIGLGQTGMCYYAVSETMKAAGIITESQFRTLGIDGGYGKHAYQFTLWAENNPKYLASLKLKRAYVSPKRAPVGSIVVYQRGVCGASAVSGHIEVITVQGEEAYHFARSDFPRYCDTQSGTAVFIPVQ